MPEGHRGKSPDFEEPTAEELALIDLEFADLNVASSGGVVEIELEKLLAMTNGKFKKVFLEIMSGYKRTKEDFLRRIESMENDDQNDGCFHEANRISTELNRKIIELSLILGGPLEVQDRLEVDSICRAINTLIVQWGVNFSADQVDDAEDENEEDKGVQIDQDDFRFEEDSYSDDEFEELEEEEEGRY